MAFCRWLGGGSDSPVTLPSEEQWQRAAQGDDGRDYPWGNTLPDQQRCNWNRQVDQTTPVDRYQQGKSPYGVMDMGGNVWEWTLSDWERGTTTDEERRSILLRGGSWSSDSPLSLQAANRRPDDPNTRLDPGYRHHVTVGFRCVRPL
jgi:formylglycine-generating enzyme required for sulfatase activity